MIIGATQDQTIHDELVAYSSSSSLGTQTHLLCVQVIVLTLCQFYGQGFRAFLLGMHTRAAVNVVLSDTSHDAGGSRHDGRVLASRQLCSPHHAVCRRPSHSRLRQGRGHGAGSAHQVWHPANTTLPFYTNMACMCSSCPCATCILSAGLQHVM